MTRPRIDIPTDRVEAFCRKWQVKEFSLFGSVLRSDFRPASDVDVLVELRPGHGRTLYDWLDMIDELKDIFGRNVHLVAKKGLKNSIRRRHILETAEVICAA